MLDKIWVYGISSKKQARYQAVTKWQVFGSFNNWNIIQLSHKSTPFDAFEDIRQFFLDGISDHMASLVQYDKYGAINTSDTTTNVYSIIKFISEAYTLQNNTKIDGQIITAGELVVKSQYLCSVQDSANWYWGQHQLQQAIIVPTRIIIHPHLDVVGITDFQDIHKLCIT